ncbi:MAG: type 4a pilus biogenesis protein PilO [Gammaproteobacteria bacterium]
MTLSDLNDLDLSNIGTAPLPIKILLILLLCGALAFAGYWFDTKKQVAQLEVVQAAEKELKVKFELRQKKAANLEAYKVLLAEMDQSFGTMLKQLPSKTEIPGLIVDISQTGLASGLEIDLFKPENEVQKDFYAEKPIRLRLKGLYHDFGYFASGIAALPRIVTLHDVTLRPGSRDNPVMTMEATARTYRYLEEDEQEGG